MSHRMFWWCFWSYTWPRQQCFGWMECNIAKKTLKLKKKWGSRTEHSLSNRKSNSAVLMRTVFSINVLKQIIKILTLLFRSPLACSIGLHMFQICVFKCTPYPSTIISFSGLLINTIFLVSHNSFFYFYFNIFPLIPHHIDLFSGTVSHIIRSWIQCIH